MLTELLHKTCIYCWEHPAEDNDLLPTSIAKFVPLQPRSSISFIKLLTFPASKAEIHQNKKRIPTRLASAFVAAGVVSIHPSLVLQALEFWLAKAHGHRVTTQEIFYAIHDLMHEQVEPWGWNCTPPRRQKTRMCMIFPFKSMSDVVLCVKGSAPGWIYHSYASHSYASLLWFIYTLGKERDFCMISTLPSLPSPWFHLRVRLHKLVLEWNGLKGFILFLVFNTMLCNCPSSLCFGDK